MGEIYPPFLDGYEPPFEAEIVFPTIAERAAGAVVSWPGSTLE